MHIVGAVVFSLVHVSAMFSARKLIYLAMSQHYDYGSLWLSIVYELQKDVITYTIILLIAFTVREYRRRREGELSRRSSRGR